MKIQHKIVYYFDGNEFSDLRKLRAYVEDKIGSILDKMPLRLPNKQALQLLSLMIENREQLCSLLSLEVDTIDGYEQRTIGIFNI